MDRIIAPYTVPQAQADTAPTTGTPGYATDGDPATNTPATQWPAYQYNAIQEELMGVIVGAGLTPDRTALNQLLLSIRTISAASQGTLVDTGTANTYAAANIVPLTVSTLTHGVRQRVTIAHSNSSASTYAPDGLAAKPIYGLGLQPLQGLELIATQIADLEYVVSPSLNSGNGAWLLLACGGGALQIPAATQSDHAAQLGQVSPAYSISAIPTTQISPAIQVIESGEIWPWVSTAYYTGYRSVNIGSPIASAYVTPRAHEVDAVGGTLSKTTYARLWAFAQENGLVVASGSWVAGSLNFVDLGSGNFQAPDLRNMFIRLAAGATDPDTANAAALGVYKADALRSHTHAQQTNTIINGGSLIYAGGSGSAWGQGGTTQAAGGTESRPKYVALYSRIHI